MKRLGFIVFLLMSSRAFATITDVQHVVSSGSAVTTAAGISATITATGAGHLLVADCNIRDNTPTSETITVSDNQSQTWTAPTVSSTVLAGIYSMFSFYVLSSAAGVTTVTFKPSGGGGSPYTSMICDVAEYSTTASGFIFDAGNSNSANTASNTESVAITTTKTNGLIYAAYQNSNGDSGTALTGFTNLNSLTANGTHQNQEQLNVAAGSYTSGEDSAGISNGQGYSGTLLAIGEVTATTPSNPRRVIISQ